MPPQTRSKLQTQIHAMDASHGSGGDSYDDSSDTIHGDETKGWDPRHGAPIRPPVQKRKWASIAVQTDDIPEALPALYHGSSASTSPDPESDEDGSYSSKGSNKRKKSLTSSSQPSKKLKPTSPAKPAASPKTPRRESVVSLEGNGPKPRSIYAPSPTPLQCSYVYPLALGPPRRPVDLRRAKGARIMPEAQIPQPAQGENGEVPPPLDPETLHKITHRCPITFSREFEMRRHIRTVHIAEEIRAVVEGRLPREQSTVIPDNWDGKTLLSKPTCAGCGTTFSRPDAVRRHQTEVNAKMENGICVECPGPKVHIRRGPRKDIFATDEPSPQAPPIAPAPIPNMALAPVPAPAPIQAVALASIPVITSAVPPEMIAAAQAAVALQTAASAAAPTSAPAAAPAQVIPNPAPMQIDAPPPAVAAPPTTDAATRAITPTGTESRPPTAAGERAELAEAELESEDDM